MILLREGSGGSAFDPFGRERDRRNGVQMILLREGSGGSAFDPLGGERERESRAIDPFGALEWSLHFSLQVLSYAPQTLSFFSLPFFLSVSVCASLSPQTQEYSTAHASYMYPES